MLISLVGKSGCGKTTISNKLKSLDNRIIHIDVDKISHQVLEYPEVVERIKNEISKDTIKDNKVDRKKLGKVVFESTKMMDILTNITWPHMEKLIDEIICSNNDKIIILDWLLLPKTKYFSQSNLRIWIEANQNDRLERVLSRSKKEHITKEYFIKRDQAGIEFEQGKYDIIITNSKNTDIDKEVKLIYDKSIISW